MAIPFGKKNKITPKKQPSQMTQAELRESVANDPTEASCSLCGKKLGRFNNVQEAVNAETAHLAEKHG